MPRTVTTFCRICENQCGLRVTVDGAQILQVEPDTEHVVSRGYACSKGLGFDRFRTSPDRLSQPQQRRGDRFSATSWEQALTDIGARLKALRKRHGANSVGLYLGNPAGYHSALPPAVAGLVRGLGTDQYFSADSLHCSNKLAVSTRMYGAATALTFPDLDRSGCLILLGGNPAISRMSFIHLPDPLARLQGIIERGGRVLHVNPRRTETARAVGEQVFIRPDTDVYFLLGFLHEVLRRKAFNPARIAQWMSGFDALWPAVKLWTPERQAAVTGISADVLRELVSAYLNADGAALHISNGVNQGRNGSLAFWAAEVINAVTGNLDRRGGSLMGQGPLAGTGLPLLPGADVQPAIPTALLADRILAADGSPLRALLVIAGNPLLSAPHSTRLTQAFSRLELLVSVDMVRNETGNFAHYLLPATHFAERPDIPHPRFSRSGLTPIPWFQYTDAVVPPPGEARNELWIISQLARHAGAPLQGSRMLQAVLNTGEALAQLPGVGRRLARLPERVLGLMCRRAGLGSLGALRQHPHGQLLPAVQGDTCLGRRIQTADGRVQLAPPDLLALLAERLPAMYAAELDAPPPLKLIGKRERYSYNSWAHNDAAPGKARPQTNYLYMHPRDADRRGLRDGERMNVIAASGRLRVPLRLSEDMMPGTVALPHGWGHQRADGLRIARLTRGVNVNILATDGAAACEPLSGMPHYSGIPVQVGHSRAESASHTAAELDSPSIQATNSPTEK